MTSFPCFLPLNFNRALVADAHGLCAALVAIAALTFVSAGAANAAPGDTELIAPGDTPALSGDGRYVAFRAESQAISSMGIHVRDRATGVTGIVSDEATDWEPHDENHRGNNAAISADVRYVAYMSQTYEYYDGENSIFRYEVLTYDKQSGATEVIASFLTARPWYYGIETSSFKVSISADGRYVTFDTHVGNLVPGDTNGVVDVFVYDRLEKTTSRVSVSTNGTEGNAHSDNATISADGRYVAFWSRACDLVAGDTNGIEDLFLHDRETGSTERVSVNSSEGQAQGWLYYEPWSRGPPALSADARYIAFASSAANLVVDDTNKDLDVFVRDRDLGTTERINVGPGGEQSNRAGFTPSMSADGRYVGFASPASNLVLGDTNERTDVFIRDLATGHTERASVTSDGVQMADGGSLPSMSADGRFVAFEGDDSYVYLHEIGGTTIWAYAVRPRALDFGSQTLFTTSPNRTFTLENTGTVALPIVRIELRGENKAQFAMTNRCGNTLAPGAACRVEVRFRPESIGLKSAKLRFVVLRGDDNAFVTRDVTGTGVRASVDVRPRSRAFGDLRVGFTSEAKYIVVRNTGASVLPIRSVYLTGTHPTQFVQVNNCPASIPVDGRCTVRVYFEPASKGPKTAVLKIWAGGGAGPEDVALSGTGI